MYIARELEREIKKYIHTKEIIAVIGPRQSGKTTLIEHLLEELDNVNIVSFDDVEVLNMFQNDVKSFVELYVKNYDYLFIDEIQYARESGRNLKYIYDNFGVKIFISGSSSTEISIQSLKYLVGRIFVFELYPFNFREFLLAKDVALQELFNKKEFGNEAEEILFKHLQEFILYGGYPRVVLSQNIEEKKLVLRNIYNTLILREVKDLFGITDSEKLIKLIKALAFQIGNLINYSDLSDLSGFKFPKTKLSIEVLEKLFIVNRCFPFTKNKRTELVKNPKIYFVDTGLRNAVLNSLDIERLNQGAIWENLIYTEYLKRGKKLNYWRTKSGAEVDFIDGKIPIEVKSSPKIGKSLHSFISKYSPEIAFVVSRKNLSKRKVNDTEIKFLSFVRFL